MIRRVVMSKSVSARIPHEQIWNDFKDYVQKTHHKKHTVLGQELEEALIFYLREKGYYGSPMNDENHNRTMSEPAAIEGNTHTSEDPTYAHIASINPKYVPIMAELQGHKQINREEFEGILTRKLHLTTDKSRREHLKSFEHLGILEPHPVVGHKILTVNQEYMHPDLP